MNDAQQEPPAVAERLRGWLGRAVAAGASDLHLIAGYPPVLRLHGDLTELPEPPLRPDEVGPLLSSLCPAEALARLRAQKDVDFSLELALEAPPPSALCPPEVLARLRAQPEPPPQGRVGRFRANLF